MHNELHSGPDGFFFGERTIKRYRVLAIDPHPLALLGLTLTIKDDPALECAGTYKDLDAGLAAAEQLAPDIIVADIDFGDSAQAEFAERLAELPCRPNILILTNKVQTPFFSTIAKLGVKGCLYKGATLETIRTTIRLTASGFNCLPNDMREKQLNVLSAREHQVINMLISGQKNCDIAKELDLSEKTVSHYRVAALKKLGMPSLALLVSQQNPGFLISQATAANQCLN